MDETAIRRLSALNNGFYRDNHESFSSTRTAGWDGWERACAHVRVASGRVRVLDVACGNMRFERYACTRFPGAELEFTCIDSCPELARPAPGATFVRSDVIEGLIAHEPLACGEGPFDVAVSFGFMHHVPTHELREELLRELVRPLAPGGIAAVSFWRFHLDSKMRAKAEKSTEEGVRATGASLDDGDYLLGWNGVPGAYRYCHSFSDGEVDRLVSSLDGVARCIDRFNADGKDGASNGYAVFRRQPGDAL